MNKRTALITVILIALLGTAVLAEEAAKKSALEVETALCSSIENRVAVGEADSFSDDVGQVYLWTRVKGATDTTFIKHVWYFEGEQMAEVKLNVKSKNWRTWSSKKILKEWDGTWEVKVLDSEGYTLSSIPFTVTRTPKGN